MNNGIFVTGTDTGVGKTVVSAALLALLRRDGIDAVPMKPVQSGCERSNEGLIATDLEFCLRAGGYVPDANEKAMMCRYKFEDACSPHLAAGRDGVEISIDQIEDDFKALNAAHEFVVVEGAGGVMVPLSPVFMMLDLMSKLALPVVLVARAGLGTINHTLLSLRALRDTGLDVAGVILNRVAADDPEYIVQDNVVVLKELGAIPVLGILRYAGENASHWRDCMKDLVPAVEVIKQRILK